MLPIGPVKSSAGGGSASWFRAHAGSPTVSYNGVSITSMSPAIIAGIVHPFSFSELDFRQKLSRFGRRGLEVNHRVRDRAVPEQLFDDVDRHALRDAVHREGMPQDVRRNLPAAAGDQAGTLAGVPHGVKRRLPRVRK